MAALDYDHIAELVASAQAGDRDAFAELYAATYQKQYRFSCHYLQDEYLAQDALQETYALALTNLPRLKEPSLFIAWLNQINFRVCHNLHRKQQRYDTELADYSNAKAEEILPSSHKQNPEDILVRIDSAEYIMNQILKLPFAESQAIILKYYQNMKHNDIAHLMNISLSSVKRYLNRGRKRLAMVFRQE